MIPILSLAIFIDTASAGFGAHPVAPVAPEAPAIPAAPTPRPIRSLMARDKKILELLNRRERTLIVKSAGDVVPALTRMDAVLVNSILADNVRPVTFIVRIQSGGRFAGGGGT